jgi:hypothetical protein
MHARNDEFLHASRVTRPRVWTGLLLNESYKVGSLIEQGAATELYDGIELSTSEAVALKVLLPQLAEDAKTRALFVDEARALRRLSQPGLLRYRACARDPHYDLTYIVTDVVGMRMSSRLANRKLSEEDIVALTKRLVLALAAAHGAGAIHRGLRPHAIALPQGRLSEATITDFNLIVAAHEKALVDQDYCAPEQSSASEGAVVGPWTDVYSLALLILSTVEARQSASERKAKPDLSSLPVNLRPVFERMLEPKPARRLQSMNEVMKELELALGSAPLRRMLSRAQSAGLAQLRRVTEREAPPVKQGPDIAELLRQAKSAPPPDEKPAAIPAPELKEPAPAPAKPAPSMAELLRQPEPAPSRLSVPAQAAPVLKDPVSAPVPALPPLSEWPLSEAPVKPVALAKFHEGHATIGRGGYARRFAVAMSALLLAASPWIVQTTLRGGQADASTVPPVEQVQTASVQPQAKTVVLPKGRVYGTDNSYSRVTLRIHRPTRVAVNGRGGRLLFSRTVQAGDTYRAPSLPDLTVTADDAGAVEVLLNGRPAGFIGANGASAQKAPLARFASLAPRPAAPSTPPRSRATPRTDPPAAPAPAPPPVEQANVPAPPPAPVVVVEPPVVQEVVPPPAPVQETPAPPAAVAAAPAPAAVEQQAVSVPPVAQPEARRPLLGRLLFWRGDRAAPAGEEATAVILAPSVTKQAADRAKAAADEAEAAEREESRRRNSAFMNSARGVSSPY